MSGQDSDCLGRIPFFLRKRLGYLTPGTFRYGDVVKIGMRSDCVLITDPADLHHVLVGQAQLFTKGSQLSSESGKRRAGRGLLTSSGAQHRDRRRLLQPLFHQRSVKSYANVVLSETEQMIARWQTGQEIDLAKEMADLSRSILISTVFGADWQHDRDRLSGAIADRRRYTDFLYFSRLPFRDRWPTSVARKHLRALETIDEIVFREIGIRQKSPRHDFLTELIQSRLPDDSCLSDQDVRDEVLTLTSAGHETTADTLAWTWYLLATHQKAEAEWRSELNWVESFDLTAPETVQELTYTRMILKESNRLYPPTWLFARVPLTDHALPSGHRVRAGNTLLLCQYLMHRHPGFYPDPEQFDPNRFHDAPQGSRLRQAYFPFGAGPHNCIGEVYSRMQSTIILATIGRQFRCELNAGQSVIPAPGVTLSPRHGISVRLIKTS